MKKSTETRKVVSTILNDFLPYLNEKQKRLFVGIAANAMGYGGLKFVHESTGIAETTILSGQKEIKSESLRDNDCNNATGTGEKTENNTKELSRNNS